MLYATVIAMSVIASCYLLLRRGNAFNPDVTPPLRLRRWTAAFLAAFALNHLWYMPIFFLSSIEDARLCDLIGGLLDSMTFFPLAIVVLLTMLQDRKRPLWPVFAMMFPVVVAGLFAVANRSYDFLPMIYVYFVLLCIGLIIYTVYSLRQYGRWLRDNYADLEHKEVWQSFVVLAFILLAFVSYAFVSEGVVCLYAMQVICVVLIFYLLWRVETLSDLSIQQCMSDSQEEITVFTESGEEAGLSPQTIDYIGQLLQQYCIDTQLYLQHDLSLFQLAKVIGTNRTYLGAYFAQEGITYNVYINDLRIRHFIRLYREAVANQRTFTAQQLASESGFRSYSTFGLAFKQRMGLTVTAWMRKNCR